VKNSSGDMFLRKELLMLKSEIDFELFEGQEWSIDEALIIGCEGGLAGLVTLASKPMVALARAVDGGDIAEAVRLQRVLIDVFHGVYGPKVTNVVNGHKHALWKLGLLDNTDTLYHLEPMTDADKRRVEACLEKHRELLD